jgi:hypothetical protein
MEVWSVERANGKVKMRNLLRQYRNREEAQLEAVVEVAQMLLLFPLRPAVAVRR